MSLACCAEQEGESCESRMPPPPPPPPDGQFFWRREALSLYRDILRASRGFTWKNEHGEVWGKVIAVSARVEFEQARHEAVRAI
jgi:hypothetical protein